MNDDKHSNDNELICPITLELFRDPVLAKDGHVYERSAITQWIQQNGTSPFTRQILRVEDLEDDCQSKKLADQRRNSIVSYTKNLDTVKLPLHSRKARNGTVHPSESLRLEHTIIRNSYCERKLSAIIFLIIIAMGSILCLSLLLILIRNGSNKNLTSPADIYTQSLCPSSSPMTTLLHLNNTAGFEYAYYSYLYKAISSNEMIVFSFQYNSSYWCLDDLSMIDINSKTNLILNGDFENGILQPFYICSTYNYSSLNLLPENSSQHSGRYAFCYTSTFYVDYLIQNLNTTKGQIYNISFWIQNRSAPVNKLTVAIIV